jgi:hypothetical protein
MARALTKTARHELVQALRQRYQTCSRDGKTRILEEFASVSGYHRKSQYAFSTVRPVRMRTSEAGADLAFTMRRRARL